MAHIYLAGKVRITIYIYIYISETILKKIKGLYQEYWKVFFVFVPICMIADVSRVERNLETFLWNLSGLSTSYCGEWWFFTPYVGLLVTFPLAYRILARNSDVLTDLVGVAFFDIFARYILPEIYGYAWAVRLPKAMFWNVFSGIITNAAPFYMGCVFAKYDLLGKIKRRFQKRGFGVLLSLMLLLAVFYMRHQTGIQYDYLYAPIFTASAIVVLEWFPWKLPRHLLQKIGEEGTTIWLVHSIYCYLLCQRIVYLPRYTILICVWLLMMSYSTSLLLKKGNNLIMDCIKKN